MTQQFLESIAVKSCFKQQVKFTKNPRQIFRVLNPKLPFETYQAMVETSRLRTLYCN